MRVCEKTATAEEPPNGAITPSRESAYVCVYWGHTAVSVLPSKLHCSPGSTSARCGRCGAPVSLPLSQFLHFYFFFCSKHLSFLTSALMVTAPLTHSHTHTHTHTVGVGGEYQCVIVSGRNTRACDWLVASSLSDSPLHLCVWERPKTGNTEITAECLHPVPKCVCKWGRSQTLAPGQFGSVTLTAFILLHKVTNMIRDRKRDR